MESHLGNDKFSEWLDQNKEDDLSNAVFLLRSDKGQLTKFVVNRLKLQESSPEFTKILEEGPTRGYAYEIPDISARDFQSLVEHIFKLASWEFRSFREVIELFKIAGRFHLLELQEEIMTTLRQIVLSGKIEIFDHATVIQAYAFFRKSDSADEFLSNAALKYILKNASELLGREDFLDLSSADLKEILDDDDLSVNSELDVYQSLIKWIWHFTKKNSMDDSSSEPMTNEIEQLMTCIRFRNMTDFEIEHCVLPMNDFLLSPVKECVDLQHYFKGKKRKSTTGLELSDCEPRKYLKRDCGDEMINFIKNLQMELEISKAKNYTTEQKIEFLKFQIEKLQSENDLQRSKLKQNVDTLEELRKLNVSQANVILKQKSVIRKISLNIKRKNIDQPPGSSGAQPLKTKVDAECQTNDQEKNNGNIVWSEEDDEHEERSAKIPIYKISTMLTSTANFLITVIVENQTTAKLELYENYFPDLGPYVNVEIDPEIMPSSADLFRFSNMKPFRGFVAYKIKEMLFVVKYCVNSRRNHNEMIVALCPIDIGEGQELLEEINDIQETWANCDDRIKEYRCTTAAGLELTLESKIFITGIQVDATMHPGAKSFISIVLSEY